MYPSIADWWNKINASHSISSYVESVSKLSDEEYQKYLSEAKLYNSELLLEPNRFHPSDTLHSMYESTLNVSGDGIIGVVKIPSLRVNLPIYHGVEESTLQDAIGHIEGSSLPIGGPSTHTIVSGHRGLPSAKLFTDLDQLEVGDYFMFQVLDDTYTYQVDQIKIVEPNDFTYLQIEEGKDLATLQTCTPYGINTHRLLVRGHRVDNLPDDFVNARSEAILIDRNLVALFIGVLIFVVMGVVLGFRNVLNKRVGKDK